jgi:hypothetical protein
MPSKHQLNKRRNNKNKDTRSAMKIYLQLPKLKPIQEKYIGHTQRLNDLKKYLEKGNEEVVNMIIDIEQTPIDKEYLDTLEKWLEEVSIVCEKWKGGINSLKKKIIKQRVKRVYEYANMSSIYDRQQKINEIIASISI